MALINFFNSIIWSKAMLVLVVGTGIVFSFSLGFFQFIHHKTMWKSILGDNESQSGISTFASFCTTMAARIGTGNVAGVAVAIYNGGPGALFWMWIVGCTNAALSFVECTLGQLYKTKIDGEYRGSGAQCAERGLRWKGYGAFMAVTLMIGAGVFMPAAATFTICDGFTNAIGIPQWAVALFIAALLGVLIIGGIKRIGKFASYVVPFMTLLYLLVVAIVMVLNFSKIPGVFRLIIESAFNRGAIMGGIEGGLIAVILQGVKRGTFSSAAGMGESTPAASATETAHPIQQGMANAAGVFLDTIIVCTATGLMLLLTDCFNTAPGIGGYQSSVAALVGKEGGIVFVQEASKTVLGGFAPIFIAIVLFLFSFTCILSYYYESETAAMYLYRGEGKEKIRQVTIWVIRILMIVLVFIWGISDSEFAWGAADLALGMCTWVNVFMLWFLFPKVRVLYQDYISQKKNGKTPVFNPDKPEFDWDGVDKELWREVYLSNMDHS